MNIVLVNGGFPDRALGGSELQTRFIGECLVAAGHTVHYAAMSTDGTRPVESIDGMSVHRWSRDEPLRSRVRALESLLRMTSADVVYCRIITWLPWVERVAGRCGVPVVAGIASDLDLRRASVIAALRVFRIREAQKRLRLNRGHRALPLADALVAQTGTQAHEATRLWGVEPTVIPNFWPDLQPPEQVSVQSPYVVWVGSIKPVKRPDRLINVASGLRSRGVRCVVVGEIQDAQEGRALRAAADQGLLEYMGPLGLEATWGVIARATALVNTSDAEGFANTFIQAWLSGVPVLSLKVDPDGIIDSQGLGAVVANEDDAVEVLSRWASDSGVRAGIGAHAREYALAVHSTGSAGARYVELIERVAAGVVRP